MTAFPQTQAGFALAPPPLPTVLLRHDLAEGSHHFDWLIAQDQRGELPLISFRCPCRIDELTAADQIDLERIDDHRPHYLDYEGPISGNRGAVHRIRTGTIIEWRRADANQWTLTLRWNDGASTPSGGQRLWLVFRGDGRWILESAPIS